ncbi:MAG TPA: hypothetical protein VIH76_14710 [Candidatus Acidoferrales bacterium]
MKVLVTFAVETEFAPWKKALTLPSRVDNGFTIHQFALGEVSADFVVTGMGAENATRCGEILMREPYDAVIAAGFAGSLRSELNAGDVIVATAVQRQSPTLGNPQALNSDRDLAALAAANGATVVETLLSVEKIAATIQEKSQLAPLANAADMESFEILSAARTHKIPGVAIRVISDSLNQDLPAGVNSLVDEMGAVNVSGVAKYIVSHPLAAPGVISLGRRSKSAAETLKRFLESYIRGLSIASNEQPHEELLGVAAR